MGKDEDPAETEEEAPPVAVKGTGVFQFPDGARYEGEYEELDGVRWREGKGAYVNGKEEYNGMWVKDQMHGDGKYRFATGAMYIGEFVNGKFEGQGRYSWEDGAVYTGKWRGNQMHDEKEGVYIDSHGVKWAGKFTNGKYYNGRVYLTLR